MSFLLLLLEGLKDASDSFGKIRYIELPYTYLTPLMDNYHINPLTGEIHIHLKERMLPSINRTGFKIVKLKVPLSRKWIREIDKAKQNELRNKIILSKKKK